MAEKENEKNENAEIVDSGIVTKESFCAVGGIFSILTLIILFTKTAVFGEIGGAVHAFLLGFVGYMAYPLMLGALYLCVAGLFGFRLVKNRAVGTFIWLAVTFITLAVQTLIPPVNAESGYLSACFKAGELFPKATVCGWLGGLLVRAFTLLFTQGVAVALFFALAAVCVLLCVTSAKKTVAETPANEVKAEQVPQATQPNVITAVEIPIMQSVQQPAPTYAPNVYAQPQAQSQSSIPVQPVAQGQGYAPQFTQRPGVMLGVSNTGGQATSAQGGYPFTTPSANGAQSWSDEERRAFLFGGSPRENFERNLSFGRNSNIDTTPMPPQDSINGNTPSYSAAYEASLNTPTENKPPMRIVQDNVPTPAYRAEESGLPTQPQPVTPLYPQTAQPVQSMQPIQAESIRPPFEPVSEPVAEPVRPTTVEPIVETARPVVEPVRPVVEPIVEPVRPNVEDERDERTGRNSISFGFGDREERFDGRDRDERNGLNIFDDEDEEEKDLRLDRNENARDVKNSFDFGRNREDVREFPTGRDLGRGVELGGRNVEREIFPEMPRDRQSTLNLGGNGDEEVQARGTMPEAVMPNIQNERSVSAVAPIKPRVIKPYVRVPLDDFDCRDVEPTANAAEVEETKNTIIATLEDFKIMGATVGSVTFGPTVTRYNIITPQGVSHKKVVALDQSIAISLHSSGINVYPNYEAGAVSIEVPNKVRQFVQLGSMLSGNTFVNSEPSSLMFAMGKDVENRKVYGDISSMVHMLVAGTTGMGKSVFLGALIISLIYKYSPEELRLILIDPKKTEFVLYNNLPHLMVNEIITDVNKAIQSLSWAIMEMNRRYEVFKEMTLNGSYVVNIDQYNSQVEKKDRLPKIVIIVDELADFMLSAKKDIEDRIQNLTQKARAAGIHLVVATQRPSTEVITGVIKANLPTRIAFGVATDVDSRVILDQSGAQHLLGKGDFFYTMQGFKTPVRVQSAFISPSDSLKVVNFIKNNNEAYFDESVAAFINKRHVEEPAEEIIDGGAKDKEFDPMCIEALRHVILSGSASISMIQRKCSTGYNRSGKIVDWMESMGYISPFEGAKARKVLITPEEFEEKYGPL